ncbi:unnamed protein product, partial [Durusdinium trenchii]
MDLVEAILTLRCSIDCSGILSSCLFFCQGSGSSSSCNKQFSPPFASPEPRGGVSPLWSYQGRRFGMACFSTLRWRASRAQVVPEQVSESAFRVHLQAELLKEETWNGWGIVVSSDEAIQELVIVAIQQSSAVKNWNLEHPECPIEVGQAILEVNGKTQRNEMLQELWNGKDQDGKALLQMLIDVQLTPRQRSFFKAAIQR